MKALLCERHGPPEALVYREVEAPLPGPGEVRIKMAAAGVNLPDGLIIQNLYQVKPALPFTPGSEVAGEINALGEGVSDFRIGDRVAAMTVHGAFAEQVVVQADRAVKLPPAMPFDVAASLLMAYGTAFHAFRQRAVLRAGETVLVLGAGGGVGLAAVQLASAMGARVIAAAGSEEKRALALAHGAEAAIDYRNEDLRERLSDWTGGKGVDVIYDPVGGAMAERAFRSIARYGRFLVIGFAAGDIPSIPINLPLLKSASIVGVFWGSFLVNEPQTHRHNMLELFEFYAQGAIRPHISRTFPLSDSAAAIRWIMDRKALGKVVITVD
ncbi:NADPH2:quinone reductase [Sphingobium faniae]|nr:NADPH2:quinone reductase [Sphingobium faniae]